MKKFINKSPFVISELSANHNGSIENAKKLISLAKKSGSDAVKLQTYTPDMMTIKDLKFSIKHGLWKKKSLWHLYQHAQTPLEWHAELFKFAKIKKIKIFSSPFSIEALNFLEKLNCPAYKIASFEMNDLNLVKQVAKTKKPMIISTGLANIKEINKTYKIAKINGCPDITLLYCVSNYPSQNSDFSLNNIKILKKKFKCRIGLSDHSLDNKISQIALTLGAEVFEKHIALENQKEGYDLKFSLTGKEIKKYKEELQGTKNLLNYKKFYRGKNELENLIFRRSIYAIENIKKNEVFTHENLKTFRPNLGLSASMLLNVIGKKSPYNIKKNSFLKKNIIKFFVKK